MMLKKAVTTAAVLGLTVLSAAGAASAKPSDGKSKAAAQAKEIAKKCAKAPDRQTRAQANLDRATKAETYVQAKLDAATAAGRTKQVAELTRKLAQVKKDVVRSTAELATIAAFVAGNCAAPAR
jgi:hypothetical protein